jgi:hypothetical protein
MKDSTYQRSFLALGLVVMALIALIATPAVTIARDGDGDGYDTKIPPIDCNDKDISINPGADEVCGDGIDNNCDGAVDEGCGGGSEADSDGDGFLDATENAGITLPSGLVLAANNNNYLPACDGAIDETLCVDAGRPDVFVVIDRAAASNLPAPPYASAVDDPLAILRGFVDASGAPVVPHELVKTANNAPREIADGQNAVIVTEMLDTDFGPLGFAPTGGTPNTTSGEVDLYTARIRNEVVKLCTQATICDKNGCADYAVNICQDESGAVVGISALQNLYTQNVLAHETWHVCSLAPSDNAEVILYHFNPNTGWVMEQSIGAKGTKARDGTVTVTLYISDTFNADSQAKYKLK